MRIECGPYPAGRSRPRQSPSVLASRRPARPVQVTAHHGNCWPWRRENVGTSAHAPAGRVHLHCRRGMPVEDLVGAPHQSAAWRFHRLPIGTDTHPVIVIAVSVQVKPDTRPHQHSPPPLADSRNTAAHLRPTTAASGSNAQCRIPLRCRVSGRRWHRRCCASGSNPPAHRCRRRGPAGDRSTLRRMVAILARIRAAAAVRSPGGAEHVHMEPLPPRPCWDRWTATGKAQSVDDPVATPCGLSLGISTAVGSAPTWRSRSANRHRLL